MTEFLKTVAKHYFYPLPQTSDGKTDYLKIADHLFVFPNRRAGLFFGQYLVELNGNKPLFSPKTITIGDLFDLFSHHAVADRTTLLFHLYKVYNTVCRRHDHAYNPEPFDSFIFWGEMLLRDFDDVDRYLADAGKVFLNVRDLKEIDQCFDGYSPEVVEAIRMFWTNVNVSDTDGKPIKNSFIQAWSIMNEVYTEFRRVLTSEKLAYDGLRKRLVIEAIEEGRCEADLNRIPNKIIIVGITAIDEADRRLLKWLQENGRIEFCWDYGGDRLRDPSQHASYFYESNTTEFPNALTDDEQRQGVIPESERRMKCIPVPSGVGQTLEAAKQLEEWGSKDALHTAVVLADENLLTSMVYSMPKGFEDYNVTMGYNLKLTPLSSLLDAITVLQKNASSLPAGPSFFYKAVQPLLGHSYTICFEPDLAKQISLSIVDKSLYQVPISLFTESAFMRSIFTPVSTIEECMEYLVNLFDTLAMHFKDDERYVLDAETILVYRQLLSRLEAQINDSGIKEINALTLLHLLQKLAAGQSVSFSGEPLSGLQVMGVLETRALDFRRIIFLSMNEGVVPAKPTQNSFIPNSLRNAFNLPTQRHRDAIFAYHFYRLLSRAEEAVFIYDNRTDGMSSGEPSRYLLQLKYQPTVFGNDNLKTVTPAFSVTTEERPVISVAKDESVMQLINRFRYGGKSNISASNIKTYVSCKLQFFFASVLNLYAEDELQDEVGSGNFGTILHGSMRDFYAPFLRKRVFADKLTDRMNDHDLLLKIVSENYKKIYRVEPDMGYPRLTCEMVIEYMLSILRHDLKLTPFTYISSEINCKTEYKVSEDLSVNMKAVFDRLDIVYDQQGLSHLRIVDYKTAAATGKLLISNIHDLFQDTANTPKEALQVMLYCYILPYLTASDHRRLNLLPSADENSYNYIEPHLYFPRAFAKDPEFKSNIVFKQVSDSGDSKECTELAITDFEKFRAEVGDSLNRMLTELFNPDIPFTQTENEENCEFCRFSSICVRMKEKKTY